MYLIGHCHLAAASGAFDPEEVFGLGARWLMLPDLADCHEWGYAAAWQAKDREAELVRAHMVADWYVHFGEARTDEPRKVGWVYRRMGIAARFYDAFFDEAASRGLRPPDQPRDSLRGFAHSMVENSIDAHLTRRGVADRWWDGLQRVFAAEETDPAAPDVAARLRHVGGWSERRDPAAEAAAYGARVVAAADPEEVAVRGMARKFGLRDSPDAVALVRSYTERILHEVPSDEYDAVCRRVIEAIAQPDAPSWRPVAWPAEAGS